MWPFDLFRKKPAVIVPYDDDAEVTAEAAREAATRISGGVYGPGDIRTFERFKTQQEAKAELMTPRVTDDYAARRARNALLSAQARDEDERRERERRHSEALRRDEINLANNRLIISVDDCDSSLARHCAPLPVRDSAPSHSHSSHSHSCDSSSSSSYSSSDSGSSSSSSSDSGSSSCSSSGGD